MPKDDVPMSGDTRNEISGGSFSAVVQARDIGSLTVQLPVRIMPALLGLPAGTPSFTGRDRDLRAMLAALEPGAARVIAVSGMGGVGKTELAVQAARAAFERGWFPGGVLFIDLFGYDDDRRLSPAQALDACLRALGVPAEHIPPEEQGRARLYASVLAAYAREGRRLLVVIDNASSQGQARPLLPTDPDTGAILTSRHTLGLLGARLVELDVLTIEDSVDLLGRALRTAREDDARVTGRSAAGDVDPDLHAHLHADIDADIDAGFDADAVRIAKLCAGLPLALQIVAALLAEDPARPLSAMAADLRDAPTRLAEMTHSDVAVQTAFDLSYRRLDKEQARLFRLLPVNPGPDISTEAAAAMAELTPRQARRALEALARAHLIERGATYGRWRMHDLVRLYAGQRSGTETGAAPRGDERTPALVWLLFHYHWNALSAARHLSPTGTPAADNPFRDRSHALDWLDTEYANLTATVYFAAATLGDLEIDNDLHPMDMVISMALDLWRYLELRRHFDTTIAFGTVALNAAIRLNRRDKVATALTNLGGALRQVRRFDEAIAACQNAITVWRKLGDKRGESIALNNLAGALGAAGRYDEVIPVYETGITILRELGDRHREAIALSNLGAALLGAERFTEARTAYEDAAALFHETGDQEGEALALSGLGNTLRNVGRTADEAISVAREAVQILHATENRHGEASALNNLGAALLKADRFEEAIAALRQAADLFGGANDRRHEGLALSNLGTALCGMNKFEEAAAAYRDSAAAFSANNNRRHAARAVLDQGNALFDAGHAEKAVEVLQEAATALRDVGDRGGEAGALYGLGNVLRGTQRFEDAVATYRAAIRLFEDAGDRPGKAKALGGLATVLGFSRADQALAALSEAIAISHDTGDQQFEDSIRGLLKSLRKSKELWDEQADLLAAGRYEEVIAAHKDLAGMLRRFGDERGAALSLSTLGIAFLETERFDQAITALTDAATAYRNTADRQGEGQTLNRLGIALQEVGRFNEAATAHEEAAQAGRDVGDQSGEGIALTNLGMALQELGRLDEATATLETAAQLLHNIGDRFGEGIARTHMEQGSA